MSARQKTKNEDVETAPDRLAVREPATYRRRLRLPAEEFSHSSERRLERVFRSGLSR